MPDGQVVFEISSDGRRAYASLDDFTRAVEQAGKKWDRTVDNSADEITKSFTRAFDIERIKNFGMKLGESLVKIAAASIDAASDLREVQNVVDVTFGEGANQINAWAKTAIEQFGLTETKAKQFTSTLGAMMKSAGLAGPEIIKMSEDMAGLAADMSSFYNIDFDTAFQKIRSGISGETEPLKALGINLSVANLNAFALEKGLSKTFDKMTQSEQIMLRYQYLMQATADAQGDFARTSDGLANSQRLLEANMQSLQTKIGAFLIPALEQATGWANNFLISMTADHGKTILDEFAEINLNTEDKIKQIDITAKKATDLLKTLLTINSTKVTLSTGETVTYEELFGKISEIKSAGGDVDAYLKGLGLNVSEVNKAYREMLHITGQLTSTIPGLSSVIDSETGALKGGTDAVEDYIQAYREGQEKILVWQKYYAQERALNERRANEYLYKYDMDFAQDRVNRLRAEYEALGGDAAYNSDVGYNVFGVRYGKTAKGEQLLQILNELGAAQSELTNATADYTNEQKANEGAAKLLAEQYDYNIKKYGELTEGADRAKTAAEETAAALSDIERAATQSTDGQADALKRVTSTIDTAAAAYKSLAEYIQKTESGIESTVAGMFGVFNKVESPMQRAIKNTKELTDELNKGLITQEEYNKKISGESDAYMTSGRIMENLKSQLEYMEEYQRMLEEAKRNNLSDELASALSDGSAESYDYLKALTARGANIEEINKLYSQVQDKKKGFVDALTQQKLKADEVFDAIVAKAQEATAGLDQSGAAEAALENTVQGMIDGIEAKLPDLKSKIDELGRALTTLEEFGMSFSGINLGSIGGSSGINLNFSGGSNGNSGVSINSQEIGLDRVPYDGYLAALHEGESILNAEEARVWRNMKYGAGMTGNQFDYGAMGSAIGANMPNFNGMQVVWNGQVLGRVIASQQADSLRTIERSGWHG